MKRIAYRAWVWVLCIAVCACAAGFLIGRFGGRSRSEKAVTKKRLSADDDD